MNRTGFFLTGLLSLTAGLVAADNGPAERLKVEVGEPVVVARGPVEEKRWGFWQFPTIERLADGRLLAGWNVAADSAKEYGTDARGYAISSDDGKEWTEIGQAEVNRLRRGIHLPNGDRLLLGWETYQTPFPLDSVDLPEPAGRYSYNYGNLMLDFYAPADLSDEARQGWPQLRYPGGAAPAVREYPEVDIPGVLQVAREGVLVRPFFMGNLIQAPDGSLWTSCYWNRLIDGEVSEFIPTFVRSDDNGRTWKFVSDIPYQADKTADPHWEARNGFTEPELAFLPDGSVLALLRVTDGNGSGPSYLARSTDNGKTWSKPRVFDDLGVLPQLLVLENGVTLASYGRPGVFVRATADPSGLIWGERVAIPGVDEWADTCAYTQLLGMDADTALLVYSDFEYPDDDGNPRKTILVRGITVTRE